MRYINNFWRCLFHFNPKYASSDDKLYGEMQCVCVRVYVVCAFTLLFVYYKVDLFQLSTLHRKFLRCMKHSIQTHALYILIVCVGCALFNRKYSSWRRNENSMYPWMRVMWNLNFTFGWLFLSLHGSLDVLIVHQIINDFFQLISTLMLSYLFDFTVMKLCEMAIIMVIMCVGFSVDDGQTYEPAT